MNTQTPRRHGALALTLTILCLALAGGVASAPAAEAARPFDVTGRSIAELAAAQAQGRVTSLQLVDAYLARIARIDRSGPTLRSVLALNPQARAQARALDRERAAGHVRSPLHGIPLLIKDNIETADPMATTAGSLALAANRGGRDAPLVARLRAAGAVILGKTNLSEWANIRSTSSVSGWSAVGGQTRNPYALDRSPCGSSSGSGAAVAASLAAAAIGTETDGSITCPSSMNGLVGIKPTVGLVPRTYVVPISHSQDTPGPIAHTVADAALLLQVMSGPDPQDAATRDAQGHFQVAADLNAGVNLTGQRIGLLPASNALSGVQALLAAAARRLAAAGATVVEVQPPAEADKLGDLELTVLLTELKADLNSYLATTPAAVKTRTLADVIAFDRAHADLEMPIFGQEQFERAEATAGLQDAGYLKARAESLRIAGRDGLDKIFAAHQLQALIAFTEGPAMPIDPVNGDALNSSGPGNLPAIAGYPHLTLPMGLVKGLPVGLSVIGLAWSDAQVLQIGAVCERLLGPVAPPRYARSTARLLELR
ncbi:MAG: amidase [Gammaproteobacteria bacterium]|nr:amidase [Gammaproteobacteria bacterium]